ncbi:MAG: hypothetical protein OHK0015_10770 [Chloroflexi bacterium OHK40]
MTSRRALLIVALVVGGLWLAACAAPASQPAAPSAPPPAEAPSETLFIAPELKDCTGVAPMQCMQVARDPAGPWELFYQPIEGFTFEPGFSYELRVRTEQVPNPPADGSSLRYILVEEVSKVAMSATPEPAAGDLPGTSWTLTELNGTPPVEGGRKATIQFDADGRASGSTGCNRYFGGYTAEAGRLTMSQMGSTRMTCPEPLMAQETTFLDVLGRAVSYTIDGDTLTVTADDGASLVFTRVA